MFYYVAYLEDDPKGTWIGANRMERKPNKERCVLGTSVWIKAVQQSEFQAYCEIAVWLEKNSRTRVSYIA